MTESEDEMPELASREELIPSKFYKNAFSRPACFGPKALLSSPSPLVSLKFKQSSILSKQSEAWTLEDSPAMTQRLPDCNLMQSPSSLSINPTKMLHNYKKSYKVKIKTENIQKYFLILNLAFKFSF